MNKTLKKIIAVVLSLMMILSLASVCFAAEEDDVHEDHPTMLSLTIAFFREIISFLRYIFYGVWVGEPGPSEIPSAPISSVGAFLA